MDKDTDLTKLKELKSAVQEKERLDKELKKLYEHRSTYFAESKKTPSYHMESEENEKDETRTINWRFEQNRTKKRKGLSVIFIVIYVAVFIASVFYIAGNADAIVEGLKNIEPFAELAHIELVYVFHSILSVAMFVLGLIWINYNI